MSLPITLSAVALVFSLLALWNAIRTWRYNREAAKIRKEA